jgi:membrane protein YdbS with pleckstrin-like domain
MSPRAWDIIFVTAAVVCALVSARYYVVGVLDKDRPLSRWAAAAFAVFSVAAVVYLWRVL